MRFHLLGLPHSCFTEDYPTDAFTQKGRRFAKMMRNDHTVFVYAPDSCDVEGVTFCPIGPHPGEFDPVRTPISWDPASPTWRWHLHYAGVELDKNVEPGDFILATTSSNVPAGHRVRDRAKTVEWAVGYEGVRADYCFFESEPWMHYVYGLNGWWGRPLDDVVPNMVDKDDFEVGESGGYLLYMGRMTKGKGVDIASAIALELDMPIIFAGPGASTPEYAHEIHCDDGTRAEGEYRGTVGFDERRALLKGAACLLVPSQYVEPFGHIASEASMSGVPVAASAWGAFSETITPDLGRTFRTVSEGAQAVRECLTLPRGQEIRDEAYRRWGFPAVQARYERAFARLEA